MSQPPVEDQQHPPPATDPAPIQGTSDATDGDAEMATEPAVSEEDARAAAEERARLQAEAREALPEEVKNASVDNVQMFTRMLENEVKMLRSDHMRLVHEQTLMKEQVKDNTDKIQQNKVLPYLVGNVVEVRWQFFGGLLCNC